jgi:hypothetical protein
VDNLNQYISDSRPIPPYEGGRQIEVPVLEMYLSKRIGEWVAFGGEKLFEKEEYLVEIVEELLQQPSGKGRGQPLLILKPEFKPLG